MAKMARIWAVHIWRQRPKGGGGGGGLGICWPFLINDVDLFWRHFYPDIGQEDIQILCTDEH